MDKHSILIITLEARCTKFVHRGGGVPLAQPNWGPPGGCLTTGLGPVPMGTGLN